MASLRPKGNKCFPICVFHEIGEDYIFSSFPEALLSKMFQIGREKRPAFIRNKGNEYELVFILLVVNS